MRLAAAALLAASVASLLIACSPQQRAVVWTDVPGLALAVELYDAQQRRDAVELAWKSDLPEALREAKEGSRAALPSLVVGRNLAHTKLKESFAPLDYLLRAGRVNGQPFYPGLLSAGKVGGRHVLLPISFNLPLILLSRSSPAAGDGFTLSLAQMAPPSAAFNARDHGAYTKMGFSPRWYSDFFITDSNELSDWDSKTNGDRSLVDDFQFRYLFIPPYRYVAEGRTLFAYMDSSRYFVVPEGNRALLDFRWFARGGRIPVLDDVVYAGLLRGVPGRSAASGFLAWLLSPAAQRSILERSRGVGAIDYSFGVAGGFSSLISVTEAIFPGFYPELVGHSPPPESLSESY